MTLPRSSRSSALVLALWLVTTTASGCATLGKGPPTIPLRITSNVFDATVWIDDRLIAPVSDFTRHEKRLVVGFHRLEVRAPGYYSHFQELDVKANTPLTLTVPLHPLLD